MDSEVHELHCWLTFLCTAFEQGGGIGCVEEGIVLARKALELCPPGHPERYDSLTLLSIHLSHRYKQLGATQDLEEAITLTREALKHCPKGHPGRSMVLNNLAECLSTRYNLLGSIQDLDEAIVLDQEALELRPKGRPGRQVSLHNLGIRLSSRYKQLGSIRDLDEAIVLNQEALDLCPTGHPHRSASLDSLANHLSTRYDLLGSAQDLDKAIFLGREALELCPKGHPHRSQPLNNLAVDLSTRYKLCGSTQDLNEAIVLGRSALDLRPKGHPDRSVSLSNLTAGLSTRYNLLGSMQDLDEAIVLARESLELRPKGHPGRSTSLNNLAFDLSTRYDLLESMEDLNEAIVLDREALELRPKGHPDRSGSLNNLAIRLSTRYRQLESMKDLDDAIVLGREALDLRPKGHPDRSTSLNNLAADLFTRYEQLRSMRDLKEVIVLDREALHLRPARHPDRSQTLYNFANHLRGQFEQSKELCDKEDVFSLYVELANITQIVSSTDLSAARGWVDSAEELQHPTVLLAYETSLRFLVQHVAIIPLLPEHLPVLKNLTSSLAVDAFSACLRNHSPNKAAELLERGRGVFWTQLTRFRSPVEDVAATGPAGRILADRFSRLASLIQTALKSSTTDQHERVWHLNLEMQTVVNKIRELPHHSRFLLPPHFSNLRRAAERGPVIVVNASQYSCDALVILLDRDPVHVPLGITQQDIRVLTVELSKITKLAMRDDATKQLAFFLRKLWEHVVSSIVDVLRTIHTTGSRIWWCPTAEFSQLPLHAAGPYRSGHKNLPDLYISSYTPTLTALIRARQSILSNPPTARKRFTVIGQGNAIGQRELPSVGTELEAIGQCMSKLSTFMRIDGEESCIVKVVEALNQCQWVHLSCHGLPNPTEPLESAFALHDGHFTIQQIIACDLKYSEFAYLSACHTTVGYEDSPDEVIHLASAMQFAGFRSVIGTMWAVDDGETNKIASTFYKHMVDDSGRLDHTRAAYALNKTMKSVDIPFDQRILYIHLGA